MRGQDEFRLSCVVADWLALALPCNSLWSHLPFGENRDAVTGARLKRMGTARGWPDYLIFTRNDKHEAVSFALELKAEKGRQSPEQKAFQSAFEDMGHVYAVCRSLADVEAVLRLYGVALKARAA
jgi:hypothetical protein